MEFITFPPVRWQHFVLVFILSILFFSFVFYHLSDFIINKHKQNEGFWVQPARGLIAGFPLAELLSKNLSNLSLAGKKLITRFDTSTRSWEAVIPSPSGNTARASGMLRFRFFRAGQGFPGIAFEFFSPQHASTQDIETFSGTLVPLSKPLFEAVLTGTLRRPGASATTIAQIVPAPSPLSRAISPQERR